ncbi:phage minor head protein [Xylanibacter muris]|uniref:Large polyvalent protein-associated domain-containing protein n=1 Tax=Xylanibacter muris TaxID=2736290 RepID=A0ABX2ANT5_9BACT|nr:phage minor head protein [Xylanibacter muris]NPD91687.1 hypothetical protein [Xylanibacter muris]
MRKVYNGFDTSGNVDDALWREVLRVINEGTVEGLARAKTPPTHDRLFYQNLRHSNEVFAAFKVHMMGEDMAAKLIDKDGNLKPFDKWLHDVSGITSHQVGSWLRTEYDTAVIRAHAAADWREFERNKDILPNLRWMPTTSPEPESSHRRYWQMKLTLPVDDPFWNGHHPGDRWNCKCSLEATDEPVNHPADLEPTVPHRGLENNPGKDGHTFSDRHPYFPDKCSRCFAYKKSGFKNRVKTWFTNRQKDCYNCPFIDGCLYGTEKGEIKDIKKKARLTLQGSSLSHPDFNGKIAISRRSIDEWTNQPHIHYAEKNRMLLYIDEVLKQSSYLGHKQDKSTKPGSKWVHIFETRIQGDRSWIVVKEYQDGTKILYSISDGESILIGLKEK